MAIKLNLTSPTQSLVKPQDRNLEVSRIDAEQRSTGQIKSNDLLTLTKAASNLNKLFQSSAKAPVIDVTRVREIKSTIENGHHKIDSTRVAQKLIHFEHALQ